MKKPILFCVGVMLLVCATVSAQPVIRVDNVLNAHSYLADIARGSWFVAFGAGMGPADIVLYSGSLPFPTQLSGTSVTFTPASGGTAVNALMLYTLAGQVAALLPSGTTAGAYDVRVTYNGQTSAAKRVNVVDRNFGFATQSQNGAGPAQATYGGLDLNRFTTGQIGQYSTRPAKPGDVVVLWGTGLGADTASDLNGGTSGDQTSAAQVQVIVGGTAVTPVYAGRSSGSPGLDQINFTVPANVTPGCFVSLRVSAGGKTSNLGSIAVASAGTSACTTANLSSAQLSRLDQGGSVVVGDLSLSKTSVAVSVPGLPSFTESTESAAGGFYRYTIDTIGYYGSANSLVQIPPCYVYQFTGTSSQISTAQHGSVQQLDAGAQLTLNGPNAANTAMPLAKDTLSYSAILYSSGFNGFGVIGSPTLTQGTYTISGTGGKDIGPFTASTTLPGNFTWTNQASIPNPIPRSTGLRIDWSGVGTGLVEITGTSEVTTGGTTANPILSYAYFYCTPQASLGTFTVPSSVLQYLPAVASNPAAGSSGILSVFVTPDFANGQGAFSAPLTAGGTLDYGYFSYLIGSSISTGWN